MNIYSSGKIKIANIASLDDLENNKEALQCNIIIIDKWEEGLLKYPTKIAFQLHTPSNIDDYLISFPSNKRSSIKKRYSEIEQNFGIKLEDPISEESFMNWESGYALFISKLPFGSYTLKPEWFEEKSKQHMGLFFYKVNNMSGGVMVKKFPTKLSMSYAWYNEELRKAGGPTYAVLRLIDECIKNNMEYLSFGQDTNLYGGHLSTGLQEFKKSWGATPTLTEASEIKGIIKNKRSECTISFYTIENDNLIETQF